MQSEKLAEIVCNLFPLTEDEVERIYIDKSKFIVSIYDFSNSRARNYEGEVKRNKVIFWKDKLKLQISLKNIRIIRKPINIAKIGKFEVWEYKRDEKLPNFPLQIPHTL
ncbi:hypothetical protein [Acidianus sp. HS-5]|uniref:hypothetical protein n=1 Tax=Acidianus sp. HS-5 TaxID=2886040 RepID=UPI001F30BD11|nr:hypothetical protein [Acidianus sp. HS-5]BDC19538.1 hypothetical protein HS5_24280 [Acidianus sp. HS-5]